MARCPKIPAEGFGPSWPVCCLTLLVAVREGLPQRLLDLGSYALDFSQSVGSHRFPRHLIQSAWATG
jgi:hypothetical protein